LELEAGEGAVVIDDYRIRAETHRPKTPGEIERAAKDLDARGLGAYTIAHVLKLNIEQVNRMLGIAARA
jgi:hypothetical protein